MPCTTISKFFKTSTSTIVTMSSIKANKKALTFVLLAFGVAMVGSTIIGSAMVTPTAAFADSGTTKLAFRTPAGAVTIPAGQSKQLGTVDVSQFSKIRVVTDERVGSPTNVNIRLTITQGNELVAQLDVLHLTPHSQITRVYDVPGTKLTIFADAVGGGTGSDSVDVLVYGN